MRGGTTGTKAGLGPEGSTAFGSQRAASGDGRRMASSCAGATISRAWRARTHGDAEGLGGVATVRRARSPTDASRWNAKSRRWSGARSGSGGDGRGSAAGPTTERHHRALGERDVPSRGSASKGEGSSARDERAVRGGTRARRLGGTLVVLVVQGQRHLHAPLGDVGRRVEAAEEERTVGRAKRREIEEGHVRRSRPGYARAGACARALVCRVARPSRVAKKKLSPHPTWSRADGE